MFPCYDEDIFIEILINESEGFKLMKTLRTAILGFGSAGQAFAKLLLEKRAEIKEKYDVCIEVVAITTRSRGSLIDKNGVDLLAAWKSLEKKGSFDAAWSSYSTITSMEVVETADYDILIELTPLVVFSGQPAIDHIKGALIRRKHVITANKGPIAWAYNELRALAQKHQCLFYFETSVMDGTPIFNLVNDTLKFCKVTEVRGILNSTTNFVLGQLAQGKAYDTVIEEGKRRGFIEADPAMDIEGWDAAAKTTALLNVLMDAGITPKDIHRQGIQGIGEKELKDAASRGNTIKLVCRGAIEKGKVVGTVKPVEIHRSTLFATIEGTSSVISVTTDLMGTISIVEHEPEIEQTAYGIFSDLIRVVENSSPVK